MNKLILTLFCVFVTIPVLPQTSTPKTPLMGWASWNQYGVNINDSIIKAQAGTMVSSGLAAAGFRYINIDDGFFNGRNTDGSLRINLVKFPYGMKTLADYIHSKGHNEYGDGKESAFAVTVNDSPATPAIALSNNILQSDATN